MAIDGKTRPASRDYRANYDRIYSPRREVLVLLPSACDHGKVAFQNDQKFCALCGEWLKDRAA